MISESKRTLPLFPRLPEVTKFGDIHATHINNTIPQFTFKNVFKEIKSADIEIAAQKMHDIKMDQAADHDIIKKNNNNNVLITIAVKRCEGQSDNRPNICHAGQ